MRVWLSLALLGLAWFAVVNLIATVPAWLSARVLLRNRRADADLVAIVRLAPSILAAIFVVLLFVPGHLWLEPTDSDESFGRFLVALTLISGAMLLRSVWRALALGAIAARARNALAQNGSALRPIAEGGRTDAYELKGFSGLSLAGIFKAHILVGSRVRRALTTHELDLAIAHEHAHRSSRDNLTRCAMFCAPDLFGWLGTARALEGRWRAEAECRADSAAVAGDERRAVVLASALLKVARLGVEQNPLSSPAWSTFHEPALLEARVRRLLSGAALVSPCHRLNLLPMFCVLLVVAAAGSALGAATEIHRLTEALVELLA